MEALEAGEHLLNANSVAHGYALAMAGQDQNVRALTREIQDRANPGEWQQVGQVDPNTFE